MPAAVRRLVLPLVLAAGACASTDVASPVGTLEPAPPTEPPSSLHTMAFARRADGAGDTAGRLAHLETAARLAPNDPVVIRELARARAVTADTAAVLDLLERMAALGSLRDPATDSAFAFLHAHPGLAAAAERIRAGSVPVVRSAVWARLPDPDLVPESIAFDAVDGALYVGSMGRRSIVRRAADGSVTTFVPSGAEGLGEVIGIRVDPARRELWVNSFARDTAAPGWMGRRGGWAELRRYALPGGALIERHAASEPASPHLFNDVAIAPTATPRPEPLRRSGRRRACSRPASTGCTSTAAG
jgi:hypothetical protein